LYNCISQFKISCTKLMYEEEIDFWKLLLKQSEMVLEHLTPVTLTFDQVTLNSTGFICYQGWMYGLGLRKVGQGVLELLIGKETL